MEGTPFIPVIDAKDVTILPTKVWIENDFLGGRHVMLQHEGCAPFCYASFFYNYLYTSNSGTLNAAMILARALSGSEHIEMRHREMQLGDLQDLSAEAKTLTLQTLAVGLPVQLHNAFGQAKPSQVVQVFNDNGTPCIVVGPSTPEQSTPSAQPA